MPGLLRVDQDGDHDLVELGGGPLEDVHVTQCHRVE
jgi:hypothetical protein